MRLSEIAALLAQGVPAPAAPVHDSLLRVLLRGVVSSLIYAVIGLVMFSLAFWIINKSVPFSLRKEIEDDQNVALGIVIASVIIGIAMILSAAIHG